MFSKKPWRLLQSWPHSRHRLMRRWLTMGRFATKAEAEGVMLLRTAACLFLKYKPHYAVSRR